MAIAFDAGSNSAYQASVSSYSWNHTITGANPFLIVVVSVLATGRVNSITYNGVNLSFLRADVNGVYRNEIWYLPAPATGTHSIAVTLSATLTSVATAASYTGVRQTNPIDNNEGANGLGAASVTIVTADANCMVIGGLTTQATSVTEGGSQTSRAQASGVLGLSDLAEYGLVTNPGTSQSVSWGGIGGLQSWAAAAVSILPTGEEEINIDKYEPIKPEIYYDVPRNQYTYPKISNVFQAIEFVSIDKYVGNHPDFIWDVRRWQYLYPHLSIVPFSDNVDWLERITPDKWLGNHPDKIFDIVRQQYLYPSYVGDPTVEVKAELQNAQSHHPDKIFDVARQQYTYPFEFSDTSPIPLTNQKSAQSYHPDIVFDVKRQQYTYPSYWGDTNVEPQVEFEWVHFQLPEKVWDVQRQQYSYPSEFRDLTPIPTVNKESAHSYHPDIIFDVRRQQYTYPTFWIDINPEPSEELGIVDHYKLPEKVWDVQRRQYTYYSAFNVFQAGPAQFVPLFGTRPKIIVFSNLDSKLILSPTNLDSKILVQLSTSS